MSFNPKGLATGIGSFPHKDASVACEIILDTIPEIPFWPQLSHIDFREQMEIQFSEALPCVKLDKDRQRMSFDTSGDITGELEKFYENVLIENLDHFQISSLFSRGIYKMLEKMSGKNLSPVKFFKSQVTGPLTVGLTTVDENKRAIYYNDVFRDVIVKGITMKARWLLKKFKLCGHNQICFVDEPILSGFGSSTYVSVQRSDVINSLNEVFEAIHHDGALVGTHCCGNTEWPLLIEAGVDIISFDAYEFGDTIGYYPDQVKKFLEKDGVLAWGIVPTSEKINQENPNSLAERLEARLQNLAKKGIDLDLIRERCLLTPSCGTGSLSEEQSEKVFHDLAEVSRLVRF